MWDSAGRLTSGGLAVDPSMGAPVTCLAAVDPRTLTVEACWPAPASQALSVGYMVQNTHTNQILVASHQGHLYVVQRTDGSRGPSFTLVRDYDLAADDVIPGGTNERLLGVAQDVAGNIWFPAVRSSVRAIRRPRP